MGFLKKKKSTRQDAGSVEAEIISPNAMVQRNNLANNQFNQNIQNGNNAGTMSLIPFHTSEERAQLGHALVWSATQQAAAGTPMEIQMFQNRVVLNQAMLCYVDNRELTQEPFYYVCNDCNHKMCRYCFMGNRGCDYVKGCRSVYRQ